MNQSTKEKLYAFLGKKTEKTQRTCFLDDDLETIEKIISNQPYSEEEDTKSSVIFRLPLIDAIKLSSLLGEVKRGGILTERVVPKEEVLKTIDNVLNQIHTTTIQKWPKRFFCETCGVEFEPFEYTTVCDCKGGKQIVDGDEETCFICGGENILHLVEMNFCKEHHK